MTYRILSNHPAGYNHDQRRQEIGSEKRSFIRIAKKQAEDIYDAGKKIKLANIEKRHEENRKRSLARKEALKKAKKNAISI